jgi:hypothetical protein
MYVIIFWHPPSTLLHMGDHENEYHHHCILLRHWEYKIDETRPGNPKPLKMLLLDSGLNALVQQLGTSKANLDIRTVRHSATGSLSEQ